MDMRGSLGLSLCSLSALVPAWMPCTTPAGRLRLDWFGGGRCAAAFQPAGWVLLVVPASLLASPCGLGPCVGCSALGLGQPHVRIDRLALRFAFTLVAVPAKFVHASAPAASAVPKSGRISRRPAGQSKRQLDKPRSSRTIQAPVGQAEIQPD